MGDAMPWVAPVDNGDQAKNRFADFCKIIMLGAVRINAMVESLQLSQHIRENVCRLFQRILDQRASLFFNRHIDQIILCCFYGVAQVSRLNLTFREIVCNYSKQPKCDPQVFHSVFVDWSLARKRGACQQRTGQEHVDMITFYNDIFFPSVEPLLFELGPIWATVKSWVTVKSDQIPEVNNKNDGHLAQCPGSPKTPPIPSQKKVSATQIVDVSPIRSSEIIMLGAVRISGMVESLRLSQQIRDSVYCLFLQILNQRASLFFNRHIDQIIMCCFYGVAKISQLKLTFREIAYNYSKQPKCDPQVFHSVFVDWSLAHKKGACQQRTGQEHVNIITFYNEIFISSVGPLLLELGPGGATLKSDRIHEVNNKNDGHLAQCSGCPTTPPFPSLPDMSLKKVSATQSVEVSPIRSSEMDALILQLEKVSCISWGEHSCLSEPFKSPDCNPFKWESEGQRSSTF